MPPNGRRYWSISNGWRTAPTSWPWSTVLRRATSLHWRGPPGAGRPQSGISRCRSERASNAWPAAAPPSARPRERPGGPASGVASVRRCMNLVYFVHDLNDPAVHRRMRMLHAGGAMVSLIGFYLGEPPAGVGGTVPLPLGRTGDARLLQRAMAVLGAALSIPRWRSVFVSADAILARQLETLVFAAFARRLLMAKAPLVFE